MFARAGCGDCHGPGRRGARLRDQRAALPRADPLLSQPRRRRHAVVPQPPHRPPGGGRHRVRLPDAAPPAVASSAMEHSHLDANQVRVRALESVLIEKGLVDPAALDALIETYETQVGPHNGARVVAKAWTDPDYRAPAARRRRRRRSRSLGYAGRQGEHMRRAGEHARRPQHGRLHALLVLPVARARPAAGLVQVRALPLARRGRPARRAARLRRRAAGRDARSASGTRPPRCATSSCRCARRAPTAGARSELAALVTRDSMIGTGLPSEP